MPPSYANTLTDEDRKQMEIHERRVLEEENESLARMSDGLKALLINKWPGGGWIASLPATNPAYVGGEEFRPGLWWFIHRDAAESAVEYAARIATSKKD